MEQKTNYMQTNTISQMIPRDAAVPLWKKYALNITEASDYFGIGEKKLRSVIERNLDSGFVLQNGVKYLIKRRQFEEFLDQTNSL